MDLDLDLRKSATSPQKLQILEKVSENLENLENIEEDQESATKMYQNPNPLFRGHFHEDELGHEHIPGEFEKPEHYLESASESQQNIKESQQNIKESVQNIKESVQNIKESVQIIKETQRIPEKNTSFMQELPSVNEEHDEFHKKKPLQTSVFEKPPAVLVTSELKPQISVTNADFPQKFERFQVPGNSRFESVTINTAQLNEKLQFSLRNSQVPGNSAQLLVNPSQSTNNLPLLSLNMSPQQQEIYYKMYYLKANTSVGLKELKDFAEISQSTQKKDQKWYLYIEEKATKLKEKLRDESKILNYMIESVIRVAKNVAQTLETLQDKQKSLYSLSSSLSTRREFDEKLRFELDFFRKRLEDLSDLLKEADLLIAIFSTLLDENLRTSLVVEYQHKDIHSLALKKYDEYHDFVNKLDLALQEYRKFYRLDLESREFHKRLQALLAVLVECDEYSRGNLQEIKALNLRVTKELQHSIEQIKENLHKYTVFFKDVEDSYTVVLKIIYFRREKLREIRDALALLQEELVSLSSSDKDKRKSLFQVLDFRAKETRKALKLMKKTAKSLRDDPVSQLFLGIRLRQSQKLLFELRAFTATTNGYLAIFAFLRDSLENLLLSKEKALRDADETAKNSEKRVAVLCRLCELRGSFEKLAETRSLAPAKLFFKENLRQISSKYEELTNSRHFSAEERQALDRCAAFLKEARHLDRESVELLAKVVQKLEAYEWTNEGNREFFPQIRKEFANKLGEFVTLNANCGPLLEEDQRKELQFSGESLRAREKLLENVDAAVLQLSKLRQFLKEVSFPKDLPQFLEALGLCCESVDAVVSASREKSVEFFVETREFLRLVRARLEKLKESKQSEVFEKGLMALLSAKSLKVNSFSQEFTNDWDFRFATVKEMKSLGSRVSTLQDLDQQINRKRLLGLRNWLSIEDLQEALVFKEFFNNCEKKSSELQEEFAVIEANIHEFFEEKRDFLENLEVLEIPALMIALKRLFPHEQDLQLSLSVYKKALETKEMLRKHGEIELGDELLLGDEEFKGKVMRFAGEIRENFERNKEEINKILDTIKQKTLHEELQNEIKRFFATLYRQFFENEGVNFKEIAEFVEFAEVLLRRPTFLAEALAEIKKKLLEFRGKAQGFRENWHSIKENFVEIERLLAAFSQKNVEKMLKAGKNQPFAGFLFFSEIKRAEEMKNIVKTQKIFDWAWVWQQLKDIVSAKVAGDNRYLARLEALKEKNVAEEIKGFDFEGVVPLFVEFLSGD